MTLHDLQARLRGELDLAASIGCGQLLKILLPGVGVEPTRCKPPKDFKS